MKRPANAAQLSPGNPKPSKAQRKLDVAEYFGDSQYEVPWTDIQDAVTEEMEEEPGWIVGKIIMKWPVRDPKILLQDPSKKQLEIKLTSSSMERLDLGIQDTIKLSLRNARVEIKKGGSSSAKMPFTLKFPGDIAIMYVLKHGKPELDGTVVDTHKRETTPEIDVPPDDWFQTPSRPIHDVDCETVRSQQSSPAKSPTPSRILPSPSSSPRRVSPVPNLAKSDVLTSPSTPAPITPLSNEASQIREASSPPLLPERVADGIFLSDSDPTNLLTKEDSSFPKPIQHEDNRRSTDPRPPLTGTDLNQKPKEDDCTKQSISNKEKKKKKSKKDRHKELNRKSASPCPPPPPVRNPALDMQPGLRTSKFLYPALSSVTSNTSCCIGVVASDNKPQLSKKGDLFITLDLFDPSNISNRPFRVTSFMRKHDAFLPPARKGHIVLTHGVKVIKWNTQLNGTVYPVRTNWVAFDPSTGRFYHADVVGVSKADIDLGPTFDPFYKPDDSEIDYFVKLGQWWRAYTEEGQQPIVCQPSQPPREHRLIGDMDTNVFFDATVEIVRVDFNRDVGQYRLIISDYTRHPQLSSDGHMGQYAIQCLTDKLSRETLTDMVGGTYWSVKNLRLKCGSIGTIECDFFAVNLQQLSDDSENVRLKELFKRKSAVSAMLSNDIPLKAVNGGLSIVSDLKENYCCDIVAELAHRSDNKDACTDLYVTDYSANAKESFVPGRLFKQIGHLPIFTIGVYGDRHIVYDLVVEGTYLFKNVKILLNEYGKIKGKINYADVNIMKVNSRSKDASIIAALEALEKRKSALYASQPSSTPSITRSPLHHRHDDQKITVGGIKEIKANGKCPNKFRIRARVIDYYPYDLEDFTALRCRKCKRYIPPNLQTCLDCDDLSKKQPEWHYRFFLRIKDEKEECLILSACDEGVIFMGGLKATDLRTDQVALEKLTKRLRSICGPVIDVHDGAEGESEFGPFLEFCVKSWPVTIEGEAKRAYAVTGCDIMCPD